MPTRAPDKAIVTFLTPTERDRVEAAGAGCYVALHRESVDQLIEDVRTRPVAAVVVSATRYQLRDAPAIARLVREFPAIPAVALLTATESRATQALLSLGQQGVRSLVDAREPTGWRDLRTLVSRDDPRSIEVIARTRIFEDLPQATLACRRFITALFEAPLGCTTVRAFAQLQGVMPTTFMTRFFRAGLPPAKRYLSYARLVRAARLIESPGYSITQAALQLEYSSPQAFSRHLQLLLGHGAAEFRRRYTGDTMLERMREELIRPYRDVLTTFDPYQSPPPGFAREALARKSA